ncbi:hypothetical protein SAMN02745221_01333 [Thermosyntropha lipolytica DSM 11003]|uniref:Uncharacterized protein n=1 Tax=Thermosyntropha lipolytica DSM 11003 TaxID=1123382 RepID=A0A1M5NZ25_9FIRM|nr:hypothetical protein [Thermosyntropha lipolytica]SHG94824.1 hypothetical protein SAMN02745221_01333 [Thermosyntropha lipolytica DSM 11003]
MLKHKKWYTGLAMLLVFCLVFMPAQVALGQTPSKVIDNELVITQLGDNGQIQDIKVLNHIRVFGKGQYVIEDNAGYKVSSLRNLYSKEAISEQNGKIKVSAAVAGDKPYEDIYYLASVKKEEIAKIKMPVSVEIEYYLDGKKVKPSDIAGKSGHLKIVATFENKTGEKKVLEFTDSKGNLVQKEAEIYTPYVVSLSGWEFSNKKFANVQAPGKAGESPGGVVVNIKDNTVVSWTVPLIPPKYPAKQYIVLEADGKDIELPSFKIAVIPVLPTTSEVDSLSQVQNSLSMLYDGFDKIQSGVGAEDKEATLLYGLNAVEQGLNQISSGLGTLIGKVKMLRFGLSNPAFDAASYDAFKGTDAKGNTPGAKDAIGLIKKTVDEKFIPALGAQKMVLTVLQGVIGTPADQGQTPSLSTSLYNDVNYLKTAVAGTPAEKVITEAIEPKLMAINHNVGVFRDGGQMITSSGTVDFPASVSALELGTTMLSNSLGKVDAGLGLMVAGLGNVDKNGNPVKSVDASGNPNTLLYALAAMQAGIEEKALPGMAKIKEGTGQIGSGAGQAKEAIYEGMKTFASVGAIADALAQKAKEADTFLGKPEGAEGSVAYVFQTPEISKQANAVKYGAGAVVVALIILLALGRPPKQAFQAGVQESA